MCVCVDVCFSRGVVHVSVIDDVLAMASILSSVCVCLGGLREHGFTDFGSVGHVCGGLLVCC